jgi:hypothetical protein
MADKWADYLISAVRYNAQETHIDKVRAHPDNGESVGSGTAVERLTVVSRLDDGYTVVTIYKGSDDKWRRGATVRKVIIDGNSYIRTDADKTKADNLGNLPRF